MLDKYTFIKGLIQDLGRLLRAVVLGDNPFLFLKTYRPSGTKVETIGVEDEIMNTRNQITLGTSVDGAVKSTFTVLAPDADPVSLETPVPVVDPTLIQFVAPERTTVRITHTQFDVDGNSSLSEVLNFTTGSSFSFQTPAGTTVQTIGVES